jgi:uncharacterized protein (DUF1015 family)
VSRVRPFSALRFARDPGPRVAPPYDVLSDAERDGLAREPENIVHLTLPPGPEGQRDYAGAARTLSRWIREGVLVRDAGEGLYVLSEETTGGRVRRGLFALLRLAEYAERAVFPHERTMAGPKRDRLLLTREVRANLEPLFFVYEDRDGKLGWIHERAAHDGELARCRGPEGTGLSLSRLEERSAFESVQAFFADRPVVIADGHHRYETMLRYRDERREAEKRAGREPQPDAPYEFVLAYLVNAFDPGTEIRAIHRRLSGRIRKPIEVLESAGFSLETLPAGADGASLEAELAASLRTDHAFVLVLPSEAPRIARRARGAEVDVRVLHDELLPEIGGELSFDHDANRVVAAARAGEIACGLLVNPLPAERLFAVVGAGEVLPQKTTYFRPKVPSGLVLREL